MKASEYWKIQHQKYSNQDWILKPSIFAKQIINLLSKKGNLIDLGAGQGQDSRFFADHNFQVTSTDFTVDALDISKSKSKNQNINFQIVDLSKKLPFDDSSFDIVYSHLALHYFDNKTTQKLFSEIYRILKKDGIFATLVNTINDSEVTESEKIEKEYFFSPVGIKKRFFSLSSFHQLIENRYKIIILDENGKTYKDDIENLIRFIGKKL
ncbi:MAG: class I SAM-dependent methyltransferase [Candidatus Shapirobacteria bacterium]|jgi:ubiquinone/menaquinone biosynthesis C-methylase UbiE|nr:class I SAM-dependent methyltransferase [Candidatus Shapirobacteria bacterium]